MMAHATSFPTETCFAVKPAGIVTSVGAFLVTSSPTPSLPPLFLPQQYILSLLIIEHADCCPAETCFAVKPVGMLIRVGVDRSPLG